jgi:hypothetical protein
MRIDDAIGSAEARVAHDVDGQRPLELFTVELAQTLAECLLMCGKQRFDGCDPAPVAGVVRRPPARFVRGRCQRQFSECSVDCSNVSEAAIAEACEPVAQRK